MATPLLMRFSAQQASQQKKPVGMLCDTSNELLKKGLFDQLNQILALEPVAPKQKILSRA
jgi:hypothetical protein